VPHNLPIALTSLVGRDADLAVVAELPAEHRLVTLVGTGGCGKTRLAQHAAADVIDRHPAGTWWVELAPLTADTQVADAVAKSIGLVPVIGADVTEHVVRYLADDEPTLLVFDNAEHVLDGVAGVVERLLSSCPSVRVLVTSREGLGIAGEAMWRVPSLKAPARDERVAPDQLGTFDAVRLFLERARRARPNLAFDDVSAPFVAAICARLDGIPLALELAAARVRSMTLERLAGGLDDAFRLLTGGSRTALPRQQNCSHRSPGASICSMRPTRPCCAGSPSSTHRSRSTAPKRSPPTTASSRPSRCSTRSPGSSTRAWSSSMTPPTAIDCSRPFVSSVSTVARAGRAGRHPHAARPLVRRRVHQHRPRSARLGPHRHGVGSARHPRRPRVGLRRRRAERLPDDRRARLGTRAVRTLRRTSPPSRKVAHPGPRRAP